MKNQEWMYDVVASPRMINIHQPVVKPEPWYTKFVIAAITVLPVMYLISAIEGM